MKDEVGTQFLLFLFRVYFPKPIGQLSGQPSLNTGSVSTHTSSYRRAAAVDFSFFDKNKSDHFYNCLIVWFRSTVKPVAHSFISSCILKETLS